METPVEWFVGDDVFDAEAAYRAGVKSIIVRYNSIKPSFRCDYFATSLNEVASFIIKSTN